MKTWNLLENLIIETHQYRGDTDVRFKDIETLVAEINNKKSLKYGKDLNPDGGLVVCQYKFDPTIWKKWFPSKDQALAMASTDKDTVNQHAGRSQGGTTMKTTWSGRVVNMPGRARRDFEMLSSAFDKYDIIMHGDIKEETSLDKKNKKVITKEAGILYKFAYSPSMGSTEERKMRLMMLLNGQKPSPLHRRPQHELPVPKE